MRSQHIDRGVKIPIPAQLPHHAVQTGHEPVCGLLQYCTLYTLQNVRYLFQPSCLTTRYRQATNSRSWYISPAPSQQAHHYVGAQ